MTYSDFVASRDSNVFIDYKTMSSKNNTVEGSVSISIYKIPVGLENRKV